MGKLSRELSSVTSIGLDLAKHVFHVHAADASGRVVVACALRRCEVMSFFASLPPCRVGMEACGSAHHWGRELIVLGHDVKLIPPVHVKPFVRRQKNDATMLRRSTRHCPVRAFASSRCARSPTRRR
jgi:transposase